MMASVLRCKQCGKPNPTVFSLSGNLKAPLCNEDIPSYASSLGSSAAQVIFPIEAFHFVQVPEDFKLFQIHQLQFNKALTFAEKIINKERAEADVMTSALEKFKKEAVDMVLEEFEQLANKGRDFHIEVEKALVGARDELADGKETKDYTFSRMAKVVQKCAETGKVPEIYAGCLRDVVNDMKRAALRALKFQSDDPVEFLAGVLQVDEVSETQNEDPEPTPEENRRFSPFKPVPNYYTPPVPKQLVSNPYKQNGPTRGYPTQSSTPVAYKSPPPLRRPRLTPLLGLSSNPTGCQICQCSLDTDNSLVSEMHEQCRVCFECINKATKTYVKCPVCKLRYPPHIRTQLEERIPGLIKVICKKRMKRFDENGGIEDSCYECGKRDLTYAHKCPNEEIMCVGCCQGAVIANAQARPGSCPKCGMMFVPEVFSEFNRGRHLCTGCKTMLVLSNVADFTRDGNGVKYFCYPCKQGEESVESWYKAG